jgi:DNA-binding XRE family transcriptional regulator
VKPAAAAAGLAGWLAMTDSGLFARAESPFFFARATMRIAGGVVSRLRKNCSLRATKIAYSWHFDALGLQMTTLADVSDRLKEVRREASLSQDQLARRAEVARTTVARMETLAKNDMSVSELVRLLEAAGYDLKVVAHGQGRTLEDILAEQRAVSGPNQ